MSLQSLKICPAIQKSKGALSQKYENFNKYLERMNNIHLIRKNKINVYCKTKKIQIKFDIFKIFRTLKKYRQNNSAEHRI